MNGEHEQCNSCKHIWEHEDDRCPECGSQDTWEFDIVTEFKSLQKQVENKDRLLSEAVTLPMTKELTDKILKALKQ